MLMAKTVLDSLNSALHHATDTDPRVYILGEDILDPYGGAFKVTRGLSTKFPDRVLTTPISEAGIVGVSSGMALRGLRPVAEIMFGDFVTLAADQLVNHASKFRWMYNDNVRVPMVVRAPMGGRRGYGPTHSQSLEKLFLGVPGLKVV
ncbi:MAG: alpha-ketoacid dehydrogenase subunit beta, partial [Chloroflexota bacterium]